jgi:hypothetical protein
MPEFEIVSLEEALIATETNRWLEEKFGLDLEEFNYLIENPGARRKHGR